MLHIAYPEPSFQIKESNGQHLIFDTLRKKWLVLTPEEWVRQNLVQYFIQVKGYPSTLIALDKIIKLGELKKRFDILIYDAHHKPWLMVECKGMDIPLSEEVLQQVLRYNIALPVEYMIITNGSHCAGFHRHNGQLQPISDLPVYAARDE